MSLVTAYTFGVTACFNWHYQLVLYLSGQGWGGIRKAYESEAVYYWFPADRRYRYASESLGEG